MKSLKIILLCSAVLLVSACNNDDDDDVKEEATTVPTFTEFARDVFAKSANSEPKAVQLDVTFKVSDNNEDFSDLIN